MYDRSHRSGGRWIDRGFLAMNDGAHARSAGAADTGAAHGPTDEASNEESSGANGDSSRQERRERPSLIAVDLGAESCRVSLLRWVDGQPEIRLVHRFANAARLEGKDLRWDIDGVCAGVAEGLRACAPLAPEGIAAIGVDGWAVDYVRLRPDGTPLANPFCYRDPRKRCTACSPGFYPTGFTSSPEFRSFR